MHEGAAGASKAMEEALEDLEISSISSVEQSQGGAALDDVDMQWTVSAAATGAGVPGTTTAAGFFV